MIPLTRLNEQSFALNPDLIERVEATPDTVVILIDGTRSVVGESVDTVIDRVIAFRARVVATANASAPTADLRLIADGSTGEER